MPGPSRSLLSSELQQVVFPLAILHQTVFAEAEKKNNAFLVLFFFHRNPVKGSGKLCVFSF